MIDDRIARHNTRVLAAAQALGGAASPIVTSLGGIIGLALSPDKGLATLPVSLVQLGVALGTLPAAFVMRRLGRRNGYILGALLGVAGGLVAAAGVARGSFIAFCLGRRGFRGVQGACDLLGHVRRACGRDHRTPDGDLDAGARSGPDVHRHFPGAGRARPPDNRRRRVP